MYSNKSIEIVSLTIIIYFKQQEIKQYVANPGGGGGGGTQMLFGRGCAAEASKPVPIFKGHFGGKGCPLLGVWRKRVPIIRGMAEKGTHYSGFLVKKMMFLCTLATKWAKISSIYSKITKVGGMFRDFQLKTGTHV